MFKVRIPVCDEGKTCRRHCCKVLHKNHHVLPHEFGNIE